MGHLKSGQGLVRVGGRVCRVIIVGMLAALFSASLAKAQPTLPKPVPENTAYVTPWWQTFLNAADDATVEVEVQKLRQLMPNRLFARSGFQVTIEVNIPNWAIDIQDQAQVDANLGATYAAIDRALARGQRLQVPLVLTIHTVTRPFWRTDAAHGAAQAEDRRNVQWHWDNSIATDWWTYSPYARKEYEFFKIHVQSIGRYLAGKAVEYPDVLVAAAGDAEVEMSLLRSNAVDASYAGPFMVADYSPFAILEFRDWVHHAGLYNDATGVYRGTGYGGLGGGYAGDLSPATDDNLDRHTFNGDFGTSFTTWDLRYFHWDLSDPIDPDPRAIPQQEFESVGWNPMPGAGAALIDGGFDAPRSFSYANYYDPFWQLWTQFRQALVHRHNVEFAKWITTSPDPHSGATFPAARWYSYQIPADYLFGLRPGDGFANLRLDSSASPVWTADVAPYGGVGITDFENTSAFAMPAARALSVNWGLLEYNPCQAGCPDLASYLPDMALIKQYRPRIIAPHAWQASVSRVEDTPFVTALAGMISDVSGIPLPATAAAGFAPPQPQQVEARSAGGTVALQWSPRMWPSEALSAWSDWTGFDHFEVYRSTAPGFTPGPGTLVGTSLSAASVDASLVAPGQHCYEIIAVSRAGLKSTPSAAACVTWPVAVLRASTTGAGQGTVTSDPSGISCGANCERTYEGGQAVRLAAAPAPGSVFAGWIGDADCIDGVVSMMADRSCTAVFVTVVAGGARSGSMDMNGDGGGDVLTFNAVTGAWAMRLGDRVGGFGAAGGTWSLGWTIKAAEFNGDGLSDVFFYNRATGAWFKGINDGSGGFAYFGGSWSPGWDFWVVDLDGNGRSDVFVYNVQNGRWFKCYSGDAAAFAYAAGGWSAGWAIYPAELDGDGRTDLFVYNDTSGLWYWCLNTTRDGFDYRDGLWILRGWELTPGDFDGNGRADLFLYSVATGQWFVALNRGVDQRFEYVPGGWSAGWGVRAGDFNADGRTDLFVYNESTGLWYECFSGTDGAGNFDFSYAGGVWSPGWQVDVTDFDADGRADVFVHSEASGSWYQCLNAGPGSFRYGGGVWEPGLSVIAAPTRSW